MTSSTPAISSSNKKRNRSQLHLDLSLPETLPALAALHSMKSRKQKIRYVSVCCGIEMNYTSSGISSSSTLVGVFTLLSSLPSLTSLTIDLGDRTLPLDALLVILRVASRLSQLTLKHVVLPGERGQELHKTLQEHAWSLQRVVLDHCSGTASIQALMTQPPRLARLEVIGTKISTMGTLTSQILVAAVVGTSLTSLKLTDVPDVQDEHIVSWCHAMVSTARPTNLQELLLNSVSLGVPAGDALEALLQQAPVWAPQLTRVSLQLGTDAVWGKGMASVLASETCTLTHLQLWVTGNRQRSVDKQTVRLLRALRQSSSSSRLQDLHIVQNPCSSSSAEVYLPTTTTLPLEEGCVSQALEETLQVNHTLGRVVLQNETHHGLMTYELPHSIEFKLTQNRVGLAALLYSTHPEMTDEAFQQQYVSAVVDGKDDLDLVFLAVSNHPALALDVLAGCEETNTEAPEATSGSDTENVDSTATPTSPYSFLKISSKTNRKFRQGVVKRFGNRRPWTASTTSSKAPSQQQRQ